MGSRAAELYYGAPAQEGVTGFTDWGGTAWLEGTNEEAHAKYVERLNAWATTEAFPVWDETELATALADADQIYATTSEATEYWAAVPRLWESYATTFQSVSIEQYRKILAAVGASSDAADTYEENRKITTHIEPIRFPTEKIPWSSTGGVFFSGCLCTGALFFPASV